MSDEAFVKMCVGLVLGGGVAVLRVRRMVVPFPTWSFRVTRMASEESYVGVRLVHVHSLWAWISWRWYVQRRSISDLFSHS